MTNDASTVICTYRVRHDAEDEFLNLLRRHWPTLHELGLVTDDASRGWRGVDEDGRPFFVEVFTWRSAEAVERAHHSSDVMEIWEPMEALCEERDGRPAMEFPHVDPVDLRQR